MSRNAPFAPYRPIAKPTTPTRRSLELSTQYQKQLIKDLTPIPPLHHVASGHLNAADGRIAARDEVLKNPRESIVS